MLYIIFSHLPILSVIHLINLSQYTKAQGLPSPRMRVVPGVIRLNDKVMLSCESFPLEASKCSFCIRIHHHSDCVTQKYSENCFLPLSGNDLIAWSGQSSTGKFEVFCYYNHGTQSPSPYSSQATVIIIGPPQLMVSSQVINDTDTVHLTCQTPQSPLVPQCFFLVGKMALNNTQPLCQLEITGKELIHWSGVRPPAHISLSCYYAVVTEETSTPHHLTSGPSQPTSITVVGSEGIWTTVVAVTGGSTCLGVLITFFLCLRTNEDLSMGPGSSDSAPGVMRHRDMPLSFTAAATEETEAQEPDRGVYDLCQVYSSIPNIPDVTQEDSTYSLLHEYNHLEFSSQQNDIYSVLQMN